MRVRLLSVAVDDIESGRRFYELQQAGLGDYFLDSLFSDIDSLLLYAGIHQKVFGYPVAALPLRDLLSRRGGGNPGLARARLPPEPRFNRKTPEAALTAVPPAPSFAF